MISAIEITGIVFLSIILILVILWYVSTFSDEGNLSSISFAKGANITYTPQGDNSVNLICPDGKQVCVYKATQICTNPNNSNVENASTDPMVTSLTAKNNNGDYTWSQFNPDTTADLTQDINATCGTGNDMNTSQSSCTYDFVPKTTTTSGKPFSCNGEIQLIASYTCQPSFSKCRTV